MHVTSRSTISRSLTGRSSTGRTITATWAARAFLIGLLGLALLGLATGCDAGGANGDENGEGTTVPTAPANLTGESTDSAVDLAWDAVDAEDLDGYNVYRDTETIEDVDGMDPVNESVLSEASYTDGSAENGTTYHYVVTAVDTDANRSDPSNEVEKTPFDSPPDRPSSNRFSSDQMPDQP